MSYPIILIHILFVGITGEKAIYKKRGEQEPEPGAPQEKPKRLRLLVDLSGSMYRFNGMIVTYLYLIKVLITKLLCTSVLFFPEAVTCSAFGMLPRQCTIGFHPNI